MLNFWYSEHTQWLRRLDIAGERMGEFQREFHTVNLARYQYQGFRIRVSGWINVALSTADTAGE